MEEDWELHDDFIAGAHHDGSQLILDIVDRNWSNEARKFVYTRRTKLVFSGVTDLDSQKISGRTLLSRKPKFFKTIRDLLNLTQKLANQYNNFGIAISLIKHLEDGYVLSTHEKGDYYIEASSYDLEEWANKPGK